MRTEEITFRGEGRDVKAYLAYPESPSPWPAIIVVHEIWGLDEHIKDVACRFAAEGYLAFAPNLYTGELEHLMQPDRIMAAMMFLRSAPPEVQRDPQKIKELIDSRPEEERAGLNAVVKVMNPLTRELFAKELVGAVAYLKSRNDVDASRIASIGFCMGGGLSARLATLSKDLWKCIIFYGENPPLDQVPNITASILGIYGGEDLRITEHVPEFEQALKEAGKTCEMHIYPGAQHAFFNDTRPMYKEDAAKDAWGKVLAFLRNL